MDVAASCHLPDWLDRVQALEPLIARHRKAFDEGRQLPTEVTEAMAAADLFRLWVPRSLGGAEMSPQDLVELVEAAAALDGSFGWCLTNAATMSRMIAYLPPDAARAWVRGSDCQFAGSTAALGIAKPVTGGFRVTGRWPFTSGIRSARRFVGLCRIEGEGDADNPGMVFCHVSTDQVSVLDTWFVSGLKGTGSHDVVMDDVFVPTSHCHGFPDATSNHPGALYRFPIVSMLTLSVSIVPLGIAKAAVAALIAVSGRTTAGTALPMRDREIVQTDLARAEALRRSGKALVLSALHDLEAALATGGPTLIEARAFFRVALAHSAESCLRAVELLASAAGASAIAESGRLERCLRDVQAAVKHVAMSPHNFTVGGQFMLGHDMAGKRF